MNFAFLKRLLPSLSWPRLASDGRAAAGRSGERCAERHLRRLGCRVLARNYTCPAGEIDLIVSDGETIVFVEVKSRSDSAHRDNPQFQVRSPQQERIGRAALFFRRETLCERRPCRFDIVTVTWIDTRSPRVDHFPDAFRPVTH